MTSRTCVLPPRLFPLLTLLLFQMRGHRLVRNETDPPSLEDRQALGAYARRYDDHFMHNGNGYTVRNQATRPQLQAEEQRWHDRMTVLKHRPAWALQPLPGFAMVISVAPAPAPTPPRRALLPLPAAPPFTPLRRAQFPTLPSPPSSSRAPRVVIDLSHLDDGPAPSATQRAQKRKLPRVIDISDDEEEASRPRKKAKKAAKVFWGSVIDLTN
ncbi:hypothetical protein C8F04DRAFT_1133908 [Mycena alexandri]|uniref:Uncharacterized protein n=1 Tax=Mycena alexandri TaxID=1745969 RepID=A0AAD6S967_9AGAR|nr:hypothetical protein C8F04DRAFT_1133908 [Mycena alexandri]